MIVLVSSDECCRLSRCTIRIIATSNAVPRTAATITGTLFTVTPETVTGSGVCSVREDSSSAKKEMIKFTFAEKQRTVGYKAHQISSSKLPSPAFLSGMMIHAY